MKKDALNFIRKNVKTIYEERRVPHGSDIDDMIIKEKVEARTLTEREAKKAVDIAVEGMVRLIWHKFEDEKPQNGQWVIAFHHDWVNEDFNPEGIRIGFLQENLASDNCPYDFVSAHWWDYQDDFIAISKNIIEGNEDAFSDNIKRSVIPEYWIEAPIFKRKDA